MLHKYMMVHNSDSHSDSKFALMDLNLPMVIFDFAIYNVMLFL